MTIVSNHPALWPLINLFEVNSYFPVVSLCIVVYDCTLTFGQELDLIWSQQWSLMTVLYLIVRYLGIPFNIINVLQNLPTVPLTDAVSTTFYIASRVVSLVVNTILDVIMVARLYAMYHGSKKMLMFLIAVLLPVTITCIVLLALQFHQASIEEAILSGTYHCIQVSGSSELLAYTWVVGSVWEFIALLLAIWSAIKHFRQRLGGWSMNDCFAVLIRTHVFYFAVFLLVSCVSLYIDFQTFVGSVDGLIFIDIVAIFAGVQMFVLGPRLILGVRAHRAEVLTASIETTVVATRASQRYSRKSDGDV